MTKISERIKYATINEGYCLICGKFGKLSKDHVPPKSFSPVIGVEQKLLLEFQQGDDIKGLAANQGSTFKTICKECNNSLAPFDQEIKRVIESLRGKILTHLTKNPSLYNIISTNANIISFLKGYVGHIISASPNIWCQSPNADIPFLDPLKNFVTGHNDDIFRTHTFLYWYYPHRMSISGSMFSIGDVSKKEMTSSAAACLYFYPLALLIVEKDSSFSEISRSSRELLPSDKSISLYVSDAHYTSSAFPFYNLRHTLLALHNAFVTVSYTAPVKK